MRTLNVIKRIVRILQLNSREVILFEIIYRILFAVCVVSLNTRLFSFAIRKAGYSYLTANNLLGFLMHPWSLIILAVIMLFMIIYVFFEVCVLFAAFQASERGERIKICHLLLRGMKYLYRVVRRRELCCIFLTLFFVAASGIFYLCPALERIKAIKDLMKNLKAMPYFFYMFLFGFYGIVLYHMPKLFMIPFIILDGKKWKEAKYCSRILWENHPIFTTGSVFLLCILIDVAGKAVLYLGTLAAAGIIGTFVDKSIQLAMVLTVFDWLQMLSVVLGNIVTVFLYIAYVTGMYYQYRDELDMEPERMISFEEEQKQLNNNRLTSKILAGIVAIFLILITYDVVSNGIYYAKRMLQETQITAHRGSSAEAPENTMSAFELAITQMADYIELDVQETKDGEIIVLHDKSLKRTTGVNLSPWNLTYEAVLSLDAGSYMGEEFAGTKIPTLAEVMELCQGNTMLNIELKNNGHDDTLVEDVVTLIENYHFESQCVITSTSLKFLKQVKERNSDLETGYILSTAYGSFYDNDAVDFFSVSSGLLNEKIVKSIHESGHEVHAWTVNSKTELERMKLLGVDNVITDYPVLAREILYREEDTEGIIEYVRLMLDR